MLKRLGVAKILLLALCAVWLVWIVWIAQADVQCHRGHTPWPLESC